MTRHGRLRFHRTLVGLIVPALIGAAFATASSLLVFRYQQATNVESLQTAFLGEIEAILMAVRGPAKRSAEAWEQKRNLVDHKFYYPHAVFDANVAHLGELHDKKLVRDIAFLYAMLEQAREEGRRLEAGTSDSEGMLRYVNYLCSAFARSIELIKELSGELPKVRRLNTGEAQRFNTMALESDVDFIAITTAKIREALVPQPVPPQK